MIKYLRHLKGVYAMPWTLKVRGNTYIGTHRVCFHSERLEKSHMLPDK